MAQKITISELRKFIQEQTLKLYAIHLLEERATKIDSEIKILSESLNAKPSVSQEIYDEIEMRMRPTDYSLPHSELNEIAEMYGVDFEEVLNIMQSYLSNRVKEEADELNSTSIEALKELENEGNTNPSFNEFIVKLNQISDFTYRHSPQDIQREFDKLTKNPNQISLFEKFVRKTLQEVKYNDQGIAFDYDDEEPETTNPYYGPAQIEPKNIHFNKHNILTVENPIIPDVLKILSKKDNAVKFTDKNEFDKFAREQKYFSASHTHSFYSEKEMENWKKNNIKDPDSEKSDIVFETGHEPVQVWDNKNKIGYIIPSKSLKEDWFEGESLSSNTSCMDNPTACMSKPEQIMDPRPEL